VAVHQILVCGTCIVVNSYEVNSYEVKQTQFESFTASTNNVYK